MNMHDFLLASPIILLALGAIVVLGVDLFVKNWPREFTIGAFLFGTAMIQWWFVARGIPSSGDVAFSGFLFVDDFALVSGLLITVSAFVALLIGSSYLKTEQIQMRAEYGALYLLATTGALLFVSAAELTTLFVSLEIMSLSVYCLCGAAMTRRNSAESALKYFLMGAFSSAFLLYGFALLYALSGTTLIQELPDAISYSGPLLYIAAALIIFGVAFKVGVVPFHFWTPDVYQGAPTPVTAFMAAVVKIAAVCGTLRLMWQALGDSIHLGAETEPLTGAIWVLSFVTMVLGNFVALRQVSFKRMLAYSSIAHGGYILMAFLAPGDEFGGGPAILFYLLAYAAMTLGAFAIFMIVCSKNSDRPGYDSIESFNGLASTNPALSICMAIFMFSLAGLPPGMSGLTGKFYLMSSAVKANFVGLAVVGMLTSVVACAYYLRVLVAIYFREPQTGSRGVGAISLPSVLGLTICLFATIFLGLFPSKIHDALSLVMSGF